MNRRSESESALTLTLRNGSELISAAIPLYGVARAALIDKVGSETPWLEASETLQALADVLSSVCAEFARSPLVPPRHRDLQRAARVAERERVVIPVDAVFDGAAMQRFLNETLSDFDLLALSLLRYRVPISRLANQHPDVIRALEQADAVELLALERDPQSRSLTCSSSVPPNSANQESR